MALETLALEFQRQRRMQRAPRVHAYNIILDFEIMRTIILVLIALQSRAGAEELLKYSELGTCLSDEYYNVNSLQCVKCSALANLVPSSDGNFCLCRLCYYKTHLMEK
jgi:hypothetical protein